MAKSNSPIRLDADLMRQAKLAGKINKRSQAEQIEYWATIGRSVAKLIDPEALVKINSGVASISLEENINHPIDADSLFDAMDSQRDNGTLKDAITTSRLRYQASNNHPGYLEQLDSAGNIKIGHFANGEFIEK